MLKNLAAWANRNKWKARVLLVVLHSVLVLLAFLLYRLLSNTTFSASLAYPVIALSGVFAYGYYLTDWSRRTLYFITANLSFFLLSLVFQVTEPEKRTVLPGIHQAYALKQSSEIKASTGKINLVKKVLEAIKKPPGNKSDRTLLTILTIVVALALTIVVAGLSCSLSCAGNGAAAALVLIAGVTVISIATIAVLRRIRRGPKQKPGVDEENQDR